MSSRHVLSLASLTIFGAAALVAMVASAADGSSASPAASKYWTISKDLGFLRRVNTDCVHPSLKPLCDAMRQTPGNNDALVAATSHLDVDAILASGDLAAVEDAHHWLSIATCRLGVNQAPKDTVVVPYTMGHPLLKLSQHLRREPGVGYAGLVLDNCKANVHASGIAGSPPRRSAFDVRRTVTSPADGPVHDFEVGFYQAHCYVEATFAPAMAKLQSCGAARLSTDERAECLRDGSHLLRRTVPAIKAMPVFVRASDFMGTLRKYVKCGDVDGRVTFAGPEDGTAGDGIDIPLFDGTRRVTWGQPTVVRGPTGAETTTMAAVDGILGIRGAMDADGELRTTMKEFRQFHPRPHAEFVDTYARGNNAIREAALACNTSLVMTPEVAAPEASPCANLVDAYDDAVVAAAEFRMAHADHITTYIMQNIPDWVYAKYLGGGVRGVSGTGGTAVVTYLCRAAYGTLDALIFPSSTHVPGLAASGPCFTQCVLDHANGTGANFCVEGLRGLFDYMQVNVTVDDVRPLFALPGAADEETAATVSPAAVVEDM